MNPALLRALIRIGEVLGTALLGAFSLFLSKVLEPMISWMTFTGLRWLIKVTRSKTLKSFYADVHKGYEKASPGSSGPTGE